MSDAPSVPFGSGLEHLLTAAAADASLAERVRSAPQVAAAMAGVSLSTTELAMLDALAPKQLESMLKTLRASDSLASAPHLPTPVATGIRIDRTPDATSDPADTPLDNAVCLGIRSDRVVEPPDRAPPMLPAGIRPDRGRRAVVATVATAAVVGAGAAAAYVLSAGSRPRRPAATPPRSGPDAGPEDASVDGGEADPGDK